MMGIVERYNGLISTGFDYAEKEKGCAPTSVFEIYVGHFKDIGAEIEAEITNLRKELAEARAENERLRDTLERLAEADARSTNSGSAQEAFAFVHAVAETALETLYPSKAKGEKK